MPAGIDDFGLSVAIYCMLKCAIEEGNAGPADNNSEAVEQNRDYIQCLANCVGPASLPDISGDEDNGDSDG